MAVLAPSRRMRSAWLLALAVLLAGCARDPAPVEPGEPTFGDAEVPPGRAFAVLWWSVLAEEDLALTGAQAVTLDVLVPPGTLAAYVNVTVAGGAAYGLDLALGDCHWRRDAAFVAGQAFAADCGGVAEGAQTLVLQTTAGALTGGLKVVALACQTDPQRLPCPAKFPVTTS